MKKNLFFSSFLCYFVSVVYIIRVGIHKMHKKKTIQKSSAARNVCYNTMNWAKKQVSLLFMTVSWSDLFLFRQTLVISFLSFRFFARRACYAYTRFYFDLSFSNWHRYIVCATRKTLKYCTCLWFCTVFAFVYLTKKKNNRI